MTGASRALIAALVVAVGALTAWVVLQEVRAHWQRAALDTPVQRGRIVAERMGCFGCHGPGGGQPAQNPGAKGGEVPGWTGGTWMMWNHDEGDVRAWIVDGRPAHRERDAGALISMPAFGKRLSTKETDDLVAYVLAVSQFGPIDDEQASAGHEVAFKLGCFGCHGSEGRGLVPNPGSLKGYIPPWDGDDFKELVRDDSELAEWVEDGISKRMRANPVARRILESQAIVMPAYREHVSQDEIRQLAAFIKWARANPRTGARQESKP